MGLLSAHILLSSSCCFFIHFFGVILEEKKTPLVSSMVCCHPLNVQHITYVETNEDDSCFYTSFEKIIIPLRIITLPPSTNLYMYCYNVSEQFQLDFAMLLMYVM